ncbi:ATPase components of ABC transporters with duplicated ATPase domains [Sphingobium sp. AP50]|uniref:ABC-F family ATP-binding cassette domain-containing protein n=1 Tax=Sphingobium sp. AP50 TaxID=1884369 RepID=UPI0008CE1FAC|nr:ABC-F family ATP-binding cassette domain-containing protein [Sphingobium sp. AP50]SEI71486.1 ATPase components of ABC transporters with duplicated ATPase domains [Sphingobium sp. AP50]
MPAILLSGLFWSAPDGTAVLSGLDFRFTSERIGLIGRNGVGKSTLLALMAGERQPSAGRVQIDGTIAMLRQSPDPDQTIADLFGVASALALLDKAETGTATMAELEQCDWTLPARLADALAEVGLTADPLTHLTHLSGGQRTRAALAACVFAQPDWLLLDEPTNHLDAEGREAVAALLKRWRGGAIVVSHDRTLLDNMDAIAELTSLGIARYGGNWSAYRAHKDVELAAAQDMLDHAERQASTIARKAQTATERQQRRDGAGARQAAKGGMPRILLGRRKEQAERSGGDAARRSDQQRQQAQEAIAEARGKIEILAPLTVALPSADLPSSRTLLRLEGVTAGHDPAHPVLRDLNLTITGPERIAITGPNGAGKSTLLHLIAGQIAPLIGQVYRPESNALLDQEASLLDPESSIADNFARLHPGATRNVIHAALARFRFRADLALQRVATLSGGQKLRAALACVLGGDTVPPLLLLDEPTNHLDLDSIAAIEQGLAAYNGALVVVSHDPAFLDAIGITRRITLPQ